MLADIYAKNTDTFVSGCREGDHYKTVKLHGHTFELYYGFYEECDRENPDIDPMPIYPDFLQNPVFTPEGLPFVTKMQDACIHYIGNRRKEAECADCEFYRHGEELIGVCTCQKNRRVLPDNNTETNTYNNTNGGTK